MWWEQKGMNPAGLIIRLNLIIFFKLSSPFIFSFKMKIFFLQYMLCVTSEYIKPELECRIWQLRGRSGRQGDPGSSRFFLSLEDNLFRIFGGDRIQV